MTSSLCNIAKEYVHEHKFSVIPVGKDKKPLLSWKEFQSRFATDEEIDEWFKNPEAQIGIVTGSISNLTVVDVEYGGDPSFLPQDTKIIKTGGGGWHYYYRYADGMMNKARIRELVDIRSEGGYVVAPPSETDKGEYSVVAEEEIAKFPIYLFRERVVNMPVESTKQGVNASQIDDYPGYGPGQRNDQMARFVGHVLTRIHPALWETEAVKIIHEANAKNSPPLPFNELMATYKSIKGREMKNPEPRDWKRQVEQPKEAFPEDGSDEVMLLSEVASRNTIGVDDVYPFEMPYFDQPLMGGAVPGDLIIIAGPTGNGKTLFAQDLTVGLMRSPRKAKALFFSYEVLPQFVWQKYQQMGLKDVDPIYIPLKHSSGSIDWIEKKITEAKQRFDVKIVCIDHLGFLTPKSGGMNLKQVSANYSTFLTQVARDVKQIAVREELIIITPAHVRKTEDLSLNDIANSAGIAQEADVVFLIEREKNKSKEAAEYYTPYTRISLAKNRRTGQSVVAWFTLFEGRFMWDTTKNKQEEMWRNIDKPAPPPPEPEPEEEEEPEPVVEVVAEPEQDALFATLLKESKDEPF